jgi:hypothetical protein
LYHSSLTIGINYTPDFSHSGAFRINDSFIIAVVMVYFKRHA